LAVSSPQATPENSERVDLANAAALLLQAKTGRDLADLLGVRHSDLNAALYWRGRINYRVFEIPKRRGGTRTISAPTGILAVIQSKLAAVLQEAHKPRSCVHGFRKQRSIVTNARQHAGRRLVLNIDLKDFFPSINFGRVRGLFMARPYNLPTEVATILAQICCHENQLPQGAPTSPVISNMVCARMDSELQRLARRCKCSYSRYADDLTFSTTFREFPGGLASADAGLAGPSLTISSALRAVIESNGFRINPEKQRLMFHDCHQEVTGLTVNRYPNTKRSYVRKLRGMLHAWERHGLEEAEREFHEEHDLRQRRPGTRPVSFARVIRGKLEFLAMVKGVDDPVYLALRRRLHALDPALVEAVPASGSGQGLGWPSYFKEYRELIYMVEGHMHDGAVRCGSAFVFNELWLATSLHNLSLPRRSIIAPPWPENASVPEWEPHPNEKVDLALVPLGDISLPPAAKFSVRQEPLAEGEEVAGVGWVAIPQRQTGLVISTGRVESISSDYSGVVETVQVSFDIAGGMSGGPVIDANGKLVGVMFENTFEKVSEGTPGRQFSHVLPARYLLDILQATASEA